MRCWAIITGEYPPQAGGVSDYTRLVARGLAARGEEVTVWCPPCAGETVGEKGIRVRRLRDPFGPRGLAQLEGGLQRDAQILVQYAPHAFGYKAMNLPFCLWLRSLRRRRPWVMFHEVAFPLGRQQPLRHNVLGVVNRVMACLLRRTAGRTFVSTPAWTALLRRLGPGPIEWLPVPSNLPEEVPPELAAATRDRLARVPGSVLLGHFGTFGSHIGSILSEILPRLLLADSRRRTVLVGRHSKEFAQAILRRHPDLAGRIVATGEIPASQAAACLTACDVLLQPYADGVSTRRTTLMGGLALGRPVVSTVGHLTEPFWQATGAVALAAVGEPDRFIEQVESLLENVDQRVELGRRARSLYCERFSVARLVAALNGDSPAAPACGSSGLGNLS